MQLKNQKAKMKDHKPYMSKINEAKIEKIGSKTLLDK